MAATIRSGQKYVFFSWKARTVLDLTGGSSSNSTPVIGYQAHLDQSPDNQVWQASDAGGGYFTLRNVRAGSYLDLSGSNSADDTPIIGYQQTGNPNQQWRFQSASSSGETPSFFIQNRATGTYADLYLGSSQNSTRVVGWAHPPPPPSDGGNYRWIAFPFNN